VRGSREVGGEIAGDLGGLGFADFTGTGVGAQWGRLEEWWCWETNPTGTAGLPKGTVGVSNPCTGETPAPPNKAVRNLGD
jgi:hypothetical protein